MLPPFVPAYSIGPLIGLVANGLLALMCLFLSLLHRSYRPTRTLCIFYFWLAVFFLGYTVYGFQLSNDSIKIWYRVMMVGLCMLPSAWIWFAASLGGRRTGPWAKAVLVWSLCSAVVFILVDHPAVISGPLEYMARGGVWRPHSTIMRPMVYAVGLLVNLYYLVVVWSRWWPVPGRPRFAWAVWAGLAIWFISGVHDAAFALGLPTPLPKTVLWLGSVWLSLCLGLAVSFQLRDLERALETSRAKFSSAFQNSPAAVTISTLENGRFLEVNDTFLRMSGRERQEVIGHSSVELGLWPDAAQRKALLEDLAGGQRGSREVTVIGKGGSQSILDLWARSVKLDGVDCLISVCHDVTARRKAERELERHRHHLEDLVSERTAELLETNQVLHQEIAQHRLAERALRESRRDLQMLFDSLQDMVFVVDSDGGLLSTNPEVSRRLGYSSQELAGMPVLDLHPPQRREEVSQVMQDLHAGRIDACSVPLLAKGGSQVPVETKYTWGRWGDKPALFGISRDISERLRAEDSLSQLAAGVAHNFNNLLAAILGNAQAALVRLGALGPQDDRLRGLMDNVVRSAEAGRGVVKRLAAYVGRRQPPDREQVVELSEAVRSALDIAEAAFSHPLPGQVEFVTDLRPGICVRARRSELMDVCLNLIKNALEAMPQGGRLRVGVRREADQALLSFADTGTGMDQATLERLFEPFFSTKGVHGRGLGLASTKGVLRALGGDVQVSSRPGRGTTFLLNLPLCEQSPEQEPAPHSPQAPGELSLLLVEDEALVAMGIEALLSEAGYKVSVAAGVGEACQLLEEMEPDLVLCDLGLCDGSGWEVGLCLARCDAERGRGRTPFLLLTGWGAPVGGLAPPEGAPPPVVVLHKPLERAMLLRAVAQAVKAA